jgi:hypothetical protein
MWPFDSIRRSRGVVLVHIDAHGLARGAWFEGDVDVLVVDERDPANRVYRLSEETPSEELQRRIGAHPLRAMLRTGAAEKTHRPIPSVFRPFGLRLSGNGPHD